MPLYEYQCEQCRNRLEAIQRFSEEPYSICPNCGGNLKKLISSPAIKFKGSGFYITDYGKSGSAAASRTSESDSAKSSDSASAKTAESGGSKSSEVSGTKSSDSTSGSGSSSSSGGDSK